MTALRKPVTRVVDFGRGPVAITMSPDGLFTFREKGRRKVFAVPIAATFVQAVGRTVAAEKAARRLARKAGSQ
jgi:hypothetical protein